MLKQTYEFSHLLQETLNITFSLWNEKHLKISSKQNLQKFLKKEIRMTHSGLKNCDSASGVSLAIGLVFN